MAPGTRINSRILERYVLPDERIVVANRHHWARMVEPVGTVVVGFLVVAFVEVKVEPALGNVALLLWWVWFALVARMLWKALEWRNEWFVATDKRLLMTYGLITHRVAMMPIRKVTDMNYARSPISRVLGYGQFLLESAGQDQAMREINWVVDPDETYRKLCDTLFGAGGHDPDEDGGGFRAPARSRVPGREREESPGEADDEEATGGPGWEVSRESVSAYQPIGTGYQPINTWGQLGRPKREKRRRGARAGRDRPAQPPVEPVEAPVYPGWDDAEDPDITGPIPRVWPRQD